MADTKISALPASTTPLAGTEVLPIVQSSTTRQVSVANLTAGRAISATELTLTTGNLIVASGQGIDFSATPGTGTSELLADYENGTFTPVVSDGAGNNAAVAFASGQYTKVGNIVTCQFYLINITTTGLTAGNAIRITLPFAVAVEYASAALYLSQIAFTTLPVGVATTGNAFFNLFEAATGANGANVLVSALTSGQADIAGSFSYLTN
jgi:hypothetical protein